MNITVCGDLFNAHVILNLSIYPPYKILSIRLRHAGESSSVLRFPALIGYCACCVCNVLGRSAGANPFSDGWVMAQWLARWTQLWVTNICL